MRKSCCLIYSMFDVFISQIYSEIHLLSLPTMGFFPLAIKNCLGLSNKICLGNYGYI